jgi:WD40 repeat protein
MIIRTAIILILLTISVVFTQADSSIVQPITIHNAIQVQLLNTIPQGYIVAIKWMSDSQELVIGANEALDFYEISTNYLVLKKHLNIPSLSDFAFSPDETRVVVGLIEAYSPLKMYDIETGNVLQELSDPDLLATGRYYAPAYNVAFSPNGDLIASAHGERGIDRSLRVWDAQTGDMVQKLPLDVYGLAFSPDNKWLVVGSKETIRVWDINRLLSATPNPVILEDLVLNAYSPFVFTPTGIAYRWEKRLQIWDITAEKVMTRLNDNHQNGWTSIATPDGSLFAIADNNVETKTYSIQLWDTIQQRIIANLENHSDFIDQLAFSPDGKFLVSAGQDGNINLWGIPAD